MIMSITGRAGFPDLTTRLLFDMRSSFPHSNLIMSFWKFCWQKHDNAMFGASRVDDALKLLEEMFVMDDVNTFNDIIIGLCRVHEAAKLVDRMIILGFSPDKISCGVVMEGVCKTGEGDEVSCPVQYFDQNGCLEEAKALLDENMVSAGICPDIYSYNILITESRTAFELLRDMQS